MIAKILRKLKYLKKKISRRHTKDTQEIQKENKK